MRNCPWNYCHDICRYSLPYWCNVASVCKEAHIHTRMLVVKKSANSTNYKSSLEHFNPIQESSWICGWTHKLLQQTTLLSTAIGLPTRAGHKLNVHKSPMTIVVRLWLYRRLNTSQMLTFIFTDTTQSTKQPRRLSPCSIAWPKCNFQNWEWKQKQKQKMGH